MGVTNPCQGNPKEVRFTILESGPGCLHTRFQDGCAQHDSDIPSGAVRLSSCQSEAPPTSLKCCCTTTCILGLGGTLAGSDNPGSAMGLILPDPFASIILDVAWEEPHCSSGGSPELVFPYLPTSSEGVRLGRDGHTDLAVAHLPAALVRLVASSDCSSYCTPTHEETCGIAV